MSCPYKDLFGKPNTGAHAYRVFNIAVVDVGATVVVAFLIARVLRRSFLWVFIGLFILGEVIHLGMCVDSTIAVWIKNTYKQLTRKET